MTQTEIKAKIADWESRLKNPSVASVPSAVAKINSEIADLKSKLETEKPKKETVKVMGKEVIAGTKEHDELIAAKKEFDKKINELSIDDMLKSKTKKAEPKKAEPKTKTDEKAETKKTPYNCDDLIKEAEERHERAKKAAKERANAPKKSEATKGKEKIEKVHDTIEKQIEAGKFTKEQVKKLIAETKDLLKLLEKALNNL
jgi:hypothetical protein